MAYTEEGSAGANQDNLPWEAEHTNPEAVFDAINQSYGDAFEGNNAQKLCIQNLISRLPPRAQILDIGSGAGCPTASMLADAGMVVTGIDVSSVMVEVARVNVPHATFHVRDMRGYRPADGQKFDAIVSIFSMIILPTSAIKEMAFKMAHWLKPGGLLVLGAIDFLDTPKADGYPEDPHGEWLNHHFMGHVLKDNVFGLGQWITLLRSADIMLLDTKGSVFDAKQSGIVAESECFFIGRKGEKDPLLGPYPSIHQADGLHKHYTLNGIGRQIVGNNGFLDTLVCHTQAVRRLSGCDLSTVDVSSDDREGHNVCDTVIATHSLHATDDMERLLSRLSSLLDREAAESTVVLLEPAPFNDTVQLLNAVAGFFNLFRIHHGALLRKADMYLRQLGFTKFQTYLMGEEYIDFSSNVDKVGTAATLMKSAFTLDDISSDAIEVALRAQVDKYFESQKHLGGNCQRIGFQRVALVASRDN